MMVGGPALSALLLLGVLVFSTPVLATNDPKENNLQRVKQQLMEKLKELFLKHLADEKRENGGEDSRTRILFRQNDSISSRSTATAVTLSLPILSAPPRFVQICLQGPLKCYNVKRDRSRASADNTYWNYTLNLKRATLLTEVRVQFHIKGFRTVPGLKPTLEVRMGTESGRRTGEVLWHLGRSQRSRRDVDSPGWNHGLCRLYNWTLSSSLVPSAQIVSPAVLQLNYCAGQCTEGADMTDNARARQKYRHQLSLASGVGPPPAVCVPTAYRSEVIIVQRGNEKQNLILDRFAATSCTCH